MRGEEVGVGGVVVGDDDGVIFDADIAVEAEKDILCEVLCVPGGVWRAETLSELMDDGLGEEGHSHLSVADVEIESSRAVPAELLVEVEELFDVPAFWVLESEILKGVFVRG